MSHYKISKVNGVEYLQLWSGNIKGKGTLIKSVGRADKLEKLLVRLNLFELVTKNNKEILTKLLEEEKLKND